jgi:tetratricopeptide (TPR) repeat protein
MKSQDPSIELLQRIVNLFTNGKFQQALTNSNHLLEKFPNSVILRNISGACNAELMQFDDAIDSYKKALEIKPGYSEAYYNMGIAFKNKGDLDASINSYKKALEIKPDYAEAYNNIGNTFSDKGDLESAIDSYKKALEIKPDYTKAKENLISLMTSYSPQKENPNLIVRANKEIRKIKIKGNISKIISDDRVVNLFSRSEDCINSLGLELETKLSQVYRRNSVELNCSRHKSIFNKHDIIPEFCFGCYKVQVEPRSIIELIKLFIVFDQLELNENNTRKCMVELRQKLQDFIRVLSIVLD